MALSTSLTLHSPSDERILGMDNARSVSGFSPKKPHDHIYRFGGIKKYSYKNASQLLEDFFAKVESAILEEVY